MEEKKDSVLDILTFLNQSKKVEHFNLKTKTREEMINYLVEQMERAEKFVPEAVEHVEYDFDRDNIPRR